MKVGQIWREYESKEPENPWGEREYTDYEIMDIKTSKKGNLWIRCKIVNTDTFHRPFIGSEHSYKAYNFIYVKEPVLIKNIE